MLGVFQVFHAFQVFQVFHAFQVFQVFHAFWLSNSPLLTCGLLHFRRMSFPEYYLFTLPSSSL